MAKRVETITIEVAFRDVFSRGLGAVQSKMKNLGTSVARNLDGAAKGAAGLQSRLQSLGGIRFGPAIRQVAALGAAYVSLQSAISAVRAVSDFEKQLVGVGKTANLSGAELEELGQKAIGISAGAPVAVGEILEIAKAAGQLGVTGSENILKFSETVAKLGRASDLGGEEAATTLARLLNVTGESVGTVDVLASVLVRLGNTYAATESEIARVATQVAQAGAAFDLSSADAAGFAAALASLGVRAELSGSAVGRTLRAIDGAVREGGAKLNRLAEIAGQPADEFQRLFETDRAGAIVKFLQGLGDISKRGGDVTATLGEFGLVGEELLKVLPTLAARSDLLASAIADANDEAKNANALNIEAARGFDTLDSRLKILGNTFAALRLKILGSASALSSVADIATDTIKVLFGLGEPLEKNVELAQRLAGWLKTFVAVAGTVVAVIVVFKAVALAIALALAPIGAVLAGISGIVSVAGTVLGTIAFLLSPLGLIVGIVVAIGIAVAAVAVDWESLGKTVGETLASLLGYFKRVGGNIAGLVKQIIAGKATFADLFGYIKAEAEATIIAIGKPISNALLPLLSVIVQTVVDGVLSVGQAFNTIARVMLRGVLFISDNVGGAIAKFIEGILDLVADGIRSVQEQLETFINKSADAVSLLKDVPLIGGQAEKLERGLRLVAGNLEAVAVGFELAGDTAVEMNKQTVASIQGIIDSSEDLNAEFNETRAGILDGIGELSESVGNFFGQDSGKIRSLEEAERQLRQFNRFAKEQFEKLFAFIAKGPDPRQAIADAARSGLNKVADLSGFRRNAASEQAAPEFALDPDTLRQRAELELELQIRTLRAGGNAEREREADLIEQAIAFKKQEAEAVKLLTDAERERYEQSGGLAVTALLENLRATQAAERADLESQQTLARGKELADEVAAARERLNESLERTAALQQSGAISSAQAQREQATAYRDYATAVKEARGELQELIDTAGRPETKQSLEKLGEGFQQQEQAIIRSVDNLRDKLRTGLQSPIQDFIIKLGEGEARFKDFAAAILRSIADILAQRAALGIVTGILGTPDTTDEKGNVVKGAKGILGGAVDSIGKGIGFDVKERGGEGETAAVELKGEGFLNGLGSKLTGFLGGVGSTFGGLLSGLGGFASSLIRGLGSVLSSVASAIGRGTGALFGFNTGGQVPGDGPDRDSVPAVLTPGEFVVRRPAVRKIGVGLLNAINALGPGQTTSDSRGTEAIRERIRQLTSIPTLSPLSPRLAFNAGGLVQGIERGATAAERVADGGPKRSSSPTAAFVVTSDEAQEMLASPEAWFAKQLRKNGKFYR